MTKIERAEEVFWRQELNLTLAKNKGGRNCKENQHWGKISVCGVQNSQKPLQQNYFAKLLQNFCKYVEVLPLRNVWKEFHMQPSLQFNFRLTS